MISTMETSHPAKSFACHGRVTFTKLWQKRTLLTMNSMAECDVSGLKAWP